MDVVYRCRKCRAEFGSADECREHEAEHEFDFAMAYRILRQTDLDKEYAACEKCPRESPHCDGCRNRARDIVLNAIDGLPHEIKEQLWESDGGEAR